MKFEKVLIATDFDGTFADDHGNISKENIDAIKYFIANGGYFTVCTGRTYQGFHKYNDEYINAPVLLANGAMAYDYKNKSIVFCDGIGDEGNEVIKKIHSDFPEASIEMYPFNETYAINLTENTNRHFTSQGIEFSTVTVPEQAKKPWIKSMIGSDGETSQKIQKMLRENFTETVFLPTRGSFIELLKKGVNKGTGLLKLAESLGVDKKDVYAVGDGYNDVEMLEVAAIAFVPENGDDEAKKSATRIVRSNNNSAIANVIEVLNEIY